MLPEPSSGLVTFLFTDIEGSTRVWEEHPDEMREALALHDSLLRRAIEGQGGYVFKTVGDAFCAAFASAEAAARAAIEGQRSLLPLAGDESPVSIRVRMALNVGEPEVREGDYFGPPVNRTARILSAAHGGQILLSAKAAELARSGLSEEVVLQERGAHRLKDLVDPEVLFQLHHPDLPSEFPPLRSLSTHPNNLPAFLTAFVGRAEEIRELHALLDAGSRLVTLTGPGGSGKTRLAAQVGADRIEQYPGGVWWADLSAIREESRLMPEIAATLGIPEDPQRSSEEQIAEKLTAGTSLLILDNFEQIVSAAERLAALLSRCLSLQILVTSRAVLNLSAEQEYPIPEMGISEATVLFMSRARSVRPSFTPDEAAVAQIEEICRRLDGIPLAIELAAAQARMLSVSQIEKQLSRRLKSLVSPFRDVSQRQRTLRGAIDWSYDLLLDEDRRLFARVSVFVGGFTLDAAEAVAAEEDVFSGLARLREQSLLRIQESGALHRFQMLETLREYGRERLEEDGAADGAQDLHAQYYREIAERGGSLLNRGSHDEGLLLLAEETENLRAAISWLLGRGRTDDAARMAADLSVFWEYRGRLREGRDILEQCMREAPPLEDASLAARLYHEAGWFAHLQGDYEFAEVTQRKAVDLYRAAGDLRGEANALNNLGATLFNAGRAEEARALYEESLRLAQQLGDNLLIASRLSNLGLLEIQTNQHDSARRRLEEAIDIYRRQRNLYGLAACLCNLSDLALHQGDFEACRRFAGEALQGFRQVEEPRGIATALTSLAEAAVREGKTQEAAGYSREGLSLALDSGLQPLFGQLLRPLAVALAASGRPEAAVRALALAARSERKSSPQEESLRAELELAVGSTTVQAIELSVFAGDPEETLRSLLRHDEEDNG